MNQLAPEEIIMNQLTLEQIKILEDAFASYPEDYSSSSNFASMQGIQEQLEELNGKPGYIFYFSDVNKEQMRFSINRMEVGKPI
jgi:hypothetical protein